VKDDSSINSINSNRGIVNQFLTDVQLT